MRIADRRADNKNANRGTVRGRESVAKSLQKDGAGRSVLIDRDGRIIGGNKTVEQASEAGIERCHHRSVGRDETYSSPAD